MFGRSSKFEPDADDSQSFSGILVNMAEAKALGEARQGAHVKNGSPRFFDDPNEEDTIGVVAELAFAQRFGLEVDRNLYENGDGQSDFKVVISNRLLTIDVKGARKPYNLLIKEKDINVCADIVVLARIEGSNNVSLLGWEHKSIMKLMPVKDFGFGIRNYYRHHTQLRSMSQLACLLNMRGKA